MKKQLVFKIGLTSILIALNIILERLLAYSVWNQTVSLSFITIGFAAVFLGWQYAVTVGALGDLIGALILPFGPYFFGFTLTNALSALIIGVFIYKKATPVKIVISVFLSKLFCTLALNTIWISILYRGGMDAFFTVLIPRLPTAALMFVIESAVFILLFSEKSKVKQQLSMAFKNI